MSQFQAQVDLLSADLLSEVAYLSFCSLLLGNLSMVSHLTWLMVPPTLSTSVPELGCSLPAIKQITGHFI